MVLGPLCSSIYLPSSPGLGLEHIRVQHPDDCIWREVLDMDALGVEISPGLARNWARLESDMVNV